MANTASDQFKEERDKVRSETAQHDVKESVSSLRADITELAGAVKRLADAEFGQAASQTQETAERSLHAMEERIRRHPTQSALIAAGAGFLVGLLISR
jgi:ElaB/YqjD/DUF883 family membrane-anchored ribosome-binding protein